MIPAENEPHPGINVIETANTPHLKPLMHLLKKHSVFLFGFHLHKVLGHKQPNDSTNTERSHDTNPPRFGIWETPSRLTELSYKKYKYKLINEGTAYWLFTTVSET